MKDPSVCYLQKKTNQNIQIYKTTRKHFHIHLWLLQHIHNVIIVPDGNSVTKLRHREKSWGKAQIVKMNMHVYCCNQEKKINKYNIFKSELKYVEHKILEEKKHFPTQLNSDNLWLKIFKRKQIQMTVTIDVLSARGPLIGNVKINPAFGSLYCSFASTLSHFMESQIRVFIETSNLPYELCCCHRFWHVALQ